MIVNHNSTSNNKNETKPVSTPRDYEKENDLGVYVRCVERLGQIAAIMNVYPKTMTLEQVYESVQDQLEKYRKLVIGR